ncbi:MAG: hypothetical protein R2759_19750 [Bacteroidales bacterium]
MQPVNHPVSIFLDADLLIDAIFGNMNMNARIVLFCQINRRLQGLSLMVKEACNPTNPW